MRVLLDTHTFIWFVDADRRLSQTARGLIEDLRNERLISMATLWEMAIKISLGTLALSGEFSTRIPTQLYRNVIDTLDIGITHLSALSALPLHHRDPFDRLLIAQAIVEGVPILSADALFDAYPIQ